jgi:hypothetical protein
LGAEEDALAVGYYQNGRSRVENLFQRWHFGGWK